MSNDKYERHEKPLKVIIAISRKKDGGSGKVIRRIVKDPRFVREDYRLVLTECVIRGGPWRVYQTVNRRCPHKAYKILQHLMIDSDRVDAHNLWLKALLQPGSRHDKLFMLDVDDPSQYDSIKEYMLDEFGLEEGYHTKTPNGFHMVYNPFDRKKFSEKFPDVEVLTDGYVFVGGVGLE